MKKASIIFKYRQLTTMILLVLLVLGMIGGGFYLRANPITRQAQAVSQQEQEAAAIQADAEAALARLDAAAPAQARALSEAQSGQRVEIVFDGATDEETTQQILTLLRQYGVPATFYFTSDTAQKQQASLLAISAAGYTVGLAADSSMSADKTRKELVELLSAEGYRMEAATGMRPTSLLYRQGEPTDSLLKAAGACYFTEVVVPAQSVGAQTFTSAE
ncbi:MAG: polysaccharide deacetylase family protein, partial [Eubacteriales bacterium]|nr:polysaccharide deacetylase family protein [Eubacteriales bacterium]